MDERSCFSWIGQVELSLLRNEKGVISREGVRSMTLLSLKKNSNGRDE